MASSPIACSLSTADVRKRLAAISEVGSAALIDVRERPQEAVVRFRRSSRTRDTLETLVTQEAECCPFLDLSLQVIGDELVLTLRAPEEARPIVDDVIRSFRDGDATRTSGRERTMTTQEGPGPATAEQSDEETTGALVGRLFEAALGAVDMVSVYLGDRLGLYRALREGGPSTPKELATRAGIHERYSREWLEQQAVTGILEVDDPAKAEGNRRYSLSPAHAEALINPDSMFSISPLARTLVAAVQALPSVMRAFRTGSGVEWSDYGPDMIESQGDFNRPWVLSLLGTAYLPSIPDVHARLQAQPPARIADVACGVGWASIAVARAYPLVRIDGFDPDERSIEIARSLAKAAGVEDRVRFEVRDGASIGTEGPYDLAIVIESIHDLSRPVEVLASIRQGLAPDGTLIVADEKVGESFVAPGDAVERLMYGFSFLVCLPSGLAEQPSAGTGTVMRPDTFRQYAADAGYAQVEILDQVEHDFLRFYRLTP